MMRRVFESGVFRMVQWLAIGLALYALTFGAGLQESAPGLQATIYNLANITVRAFIGYWIARNVLGRLGLTCHEQEQGAIARAIVIAAVILTSR